MRDYRRKIEQSFQLDVLNFFRSFPGNFERKTILSSEHETREFLSFQTSQRNLVNFSSKRSCLCSGALKVRCEICKRERKVVCHLYVKDSRSLSVLLEILQMSRGKYILLDFAGTKEKYSSFVRSRNFRMKLANETKDIHDLRSLDSSYPNIHSEYSTQVYSVLYFVKFKNIFRGH